MKFSLENVMKLIHKYVLVPFSAVVVLLFAIELYLFPVVGMCTALFIADGITESWEDESAKEVFGWVMVAIQVCVSTGLLFLFIINVQTYLGK